MRPTRVVPLLLIALLLPTGHAFGQVGTAIVTIPPSVSFAVTNVNNATTGSPNPAHVSYNTAILVTGQRLHFSVQADTASFAPPGAGGTISASKVSWTTANALGGSGNNGTLSGSTFVQVYQSNAYVVTPLAGSVDLTFTLAAPGSSIRAGVHSLTMRWKIEAI
jgi:hypothetical protein